MITPIVAENRFTSYFNPQRAALLTDVFKRTVIEAVVTTAIVSITAVFIASGSGVVLLATSAAAMILFNAILRITVAELTYRESIESSNTRKALIFGLNYLVPTSFSAITSASTDVLVHEAGHAAAASLLFTNARPSITVEPFSGGYTRYFISGLTELGKKIGFRNSDMIVSAAGSATAVAFGAVLLSGSYLVQDSHPELSRYLFISSLVNITNHAIYALSVLWTPLTNTGHDFVYLGLHGVSPLLACGIIVAVPIVVKLAFLGASVLFSAGSPTLPRLTIAA